QTNFAPSRNCLRTFVGMESNPKEDHHKHNAKEDRKSEHDRKKQIQQGNLRLDRQPGDGLPINHDHKKGRGGIHTWEGPVGEGHVRFNIAPPAIDKKDPNYVDEDDE
ncbi:unnamed protein product, partial [Ilex paraguariensis]